MALVWISGSIVNTVASRHSAQVAIALIPAGVTLKRVVAEWNIDVVSQESGVIQTWVTYGVLSLIEVTVGNPPPDPDPVDEGGFDFRDILYSQREVLGFPNIFVGWWRVPGNETTAKLDVTVNRRELNDGMTVWWNWGLPNFTGAGVEVGFDRIWFRVLVDDHF